MTNELATIPRYEVRDLETMAKKVQQSGLFGLTESQAFTLMLLAESDGIHPIQAVRRYHVIQGRPAMKADAMLAEFQRIGGSVVWHTRTNDEHSATFKHPVHAPDGEKVSFTKKDAERAKLDKNDMWTKYPANMLRARVISNGVRLVAPGIIVGIYTPEEVIEMEPVRTTLAHPEPEQPIEKLPPPQNNSGHGRGQYGSPDQIRAYMEKMEGYVRERNQRWLDVWQDPNDGTFPEGIEKDLVRVHQCDNHLVKWGVATNRLDPAVLQKGDIKARQIGAYTAVIYHQEGGRAALAKELARYIDEKAQEATDEIRRKNPALFERELGDMEGVDDSLPENAAVEEVTV